MAGAIAENSDGWIVTTFSAKPDSTTRRTIRRHVMRNKNTREHQQTAKLTQLMLRYEEQWQRQRDAWTFPLRYADEKDWAPQPPRQLASDLACFDFGFELKPYMLDLIHQAFINIKPSVYVIEQTLVRAKKDDMFCLANLAQHPAMLHGVIHMTQSFLDAARGVEQGSVARHHLGETLRHLQLALDGDQEALANSNMAVVICLATASTVVGDVHGLMMHMDGLHRLVAARGGIDSLGPGSMVEYIAQRLDFGLVLSIGPPTRFFRYVSWGPHIALDCATQCPELKILCPRPDERLMNVWADIREFSRVSNQATRTGVKMSPGFFYRLADTVPYRLMTLRFDLNSTSELLRLCMLAYTKSLLTRIPGPGKSLVYLHSNLKAALLEHSLRDGLGSTPFSFWALSVAVITVFEDFDRDWIKELFISSAESNQFHSWESARASLKSFLWMDLVYDAKGKQLFSAWMRDSCA